MQFYGALILLMTLSVACGLTCYQCQGKTCTNKLTCPPFFDRCSSTVLDGVIIKSCMATTTCIGPIKCCEGDLCNSAVPTGSSVLLLLASSAIITLFL
ncbi:lymphocyte antigen 6B-like isoform X3 [Sander lucioperca]|uniref:lymphocyte antigen 6B-like isoform X3 n=1 Tax=Sander lucioperca TaxID=283035 RepID=UPI00125DD0D5|nr:lymphocyte antigen 6B-like isoform X3 [Sander lucioperca]